MSTSPRRDASGPGREAGPAGRSGASKSGGPKSPLDPAQRRTTLLWIVGAVLLLLLFQSTLVDRPEEIRFSRFLELVDSGRVEQVDISETGVAGTYSTGSGDGAESTRFTSDIAANFEANSLVRRLQANDVEFSFSAPSPWASFFFAWILPFGLIALLYYFFFYRRVRQQLGGQGGPLSLGKNKAKLYDRTDLKTSFNDVAGVDEVEVELQELVDSDLRDEPRIAILLRIRRVEAFLVLDVDHRASAQCLADEVTARIRTVRWNAA
jgi:cell division protease FtsH